MAGKKSPQWRKVFLRALARTGNARASAVEAGVDVATAYDHRIKDPAFAGQWAAALATFKARPAGRGGKPLRLRSGQAGKAGELVLRRTKHGDKLVRAAPGRWCARVEESFFDGLELTGCVRTAAAAAGISTNALYARRKAYPEFAERWDEIEARAVQQLPGLLHTAAVVSLGPDGDAGVGGAGKKRRGRGRLPRVSVDQAIRISRIKGAGAGDGRRGGVRLGRRAASREELEEELVKLLGMMKRRRRKERLAQGWTEAAEDIWIPPGWVFAGETGAKAEGGGAGDAEDRDPFEDFVRSFGKSGEARDCPPGVERDDGASAPAAKQGEDGEEGDREESDGEEGECRED